MTRRGVVRCLVAAVLFGLTTPATSVLAGDASPFVLAGLLYLGAGIAALPSSVRRPPDRAAWRADGRHAAAAVVTGGLVGPVLLVAGLARADAASASIMLNFELAATVALAATLFREHLGRRLVLAAGLVTLAGIVLTWGPGATASSGLLLVGAACVAWGFDNGITAGIDQLAPEHVVLLKGFVAGSVNVMIGLTLASGLRGLDGWAVLSALLIGMAGYGLSITLWVKGARDLGAARGQVIFATAPFIGAVGAWLLLGESVQPVQIVAVVLAAAGVALALDTAHDHPHRHAALTHEHEHTHDDEHHGHRHDPMPVGAHTHRHRHVELVHAHPHMPDLHHRHDHD